MTLKTILYELTKILISFTPSFVKQNKNKKRGHTLQMALSEVQFIVSYKLTLSKTISVMINAFHYLFRCLSSRTKFLQAGEH